MDEQQKSIDFVCSLYNPKVGNCWEETQEKTQKVYTVEMWDQSAGELNTPAHTGPIATPTE
jgi:hypothetical protein